MAELLLPEDYVSPTVTDGQARDFANRVLYGVANRLSADEAWTSISLGRHIDLFEIKRSLAFEANYSPEFKGFSYSVNLATILPIGEEWNPDVFAGVIRRALQAESEGETASAVQTWFNNIEDNDIDDQGYIAVEHGYYFVIPYRKSWANTTKTMSLTFLDDEGDNLEEELGYVSESLLSNIPSQDIENLVKFGEKLADTPSYEQELSKITINDLDFIMSILKSLRLVRSNCKTLSTKVQ